MKPFTKLASLLLGIVALLHLYRLVRPVEILIDGGAVPQWASMVGLAVAGLLSLMLWREARR